MSIENKCCEFYRRRDWQSLHCVLDSASPGRDADERNLIAHWRATALSAEDRRLEAIDAFPLFD